MFVISDQLFQLVSLDEVAVPDAEDEAECPLGELAGLPGTVLASTLGSLKLSALDPAPLFIFVVLPSLSESSTPWFVTSGEVVDTISPMTSAFGSSFIGPNKSA